MSLGSPRSQTTTKRVTKTTRFTSRHTQTTKRPTWKDIDQCKNPFKSIFLGSDENVYSVNSNHDIYRYDMTTRTWNSKPVRDLFYNLEYDFTCAILDNKKRNWFFKSNYNTILFFI